MNYNAFSPRVCSLVWEWTERQNKHFRIKISDIPASQFHLQVEIKLESLCRSTGDGKRIVQGKILEREAYIFMRVMVIIFRAFSLFPSSKLITSCGISMALLMVIFKISPTQAVLIHQQSGG